MKVLFRSMIVYSIFFSALAFAALVDAQVRPGPESVVGAIITYDKKVLGPSLNTVIFQNIRLETDSEYLGSQFFRFKQPVGASGNIFQTTLKRLCNRLGYAEQNEELTILEVFPSNANRHAAHFAKVIDDGSGKIDFVKLGTYGTYQVIDLACTGAQPAQP